VSALPQITARVTGPDPVLVKYMNPLLTLINTILDPPHLRANNPLQFSSSKVRYPVPLVEFCNQLLP
jgi:hypothetical protein